MKEGLCDGFPQAWNLIATLLPLDTPDFGIRDWGPAFGV